MTTKDIIELLSQTQEEISSLHHMVDWNVPNKEMKAKAKCKIDEILKQVSVIRYELTERNNK